jgi:hypothetical protein
MFKSVFGLLSEAPLAYLVLFIIAAGDAIIPALPSESAVFLAGVPSAAESNLALESALLDQRCLTQGAGWRPTLHSCRSAATKKQPNASVPAGKGCPPISNKAAGPMKIHSSRGALGAEPQEPEHRPPPPTPAFRRC